MDRSDSPNTVEITRDLRAFAAEVGFDSVGICDAHVSPAWPRFTEWLDKGHNGTMRWLEDRREAYRHPESVLPEARSLVMLTKNYRTEKAQAPQPGQGRISKYAWGTADYHDVIHAQLKRMRRWMEERVPGSSSRGVVDTAPLLERQFAQAAGLGWQGKNTLLLQPESGSLFFLAAFLTSVELVADSPFETDHCGTCTACLDACPTNAFPEPYVLDARRCISYLTIELRDDIPVELRNQMDGWLFGCDVCQDVCPWNRHAPLTATAAFQPQAGSNPVDLCELFMLGEEGFRNRFRKTPLWRTKRRGILRNAAVLLGATPDASFVVALTRGLNDLEPLVRSASAWALGQVGTAEAIEALQERMKQESEASVLTEIQSALANTHE